MLAIINRIAEALGVEAQIVVVGFLFLGALLVFLSIVITVRERSQSRVNRRMRDQAATSASLFLPAESAPSSLAKAFLPTEQRERNKVRRDLAHAGFTGPNAVVLYYLLRVVVGLVLPAALAAAVILRDQIPMPEAVRVQLGQFGTNQMMMGFGLLIMIGFYGPAAWLSARAADRRDRVELAFPNALDLLQVSVEAGLGFDAAIARVADEMETAGPEIGIEFRVAQQEILAGRDRELAYRAMAERLGIEEAYAFVNVVLQSMRFGTSMGQALLAYSADMRQRREIRAQEKANKLPVYMSAVMAGLMMPALLIVTIGPVVLRYLDTFGN